MFPLLTATGRIDLVTRAELVYQPFRAAVLVGVVALTQSIGAYALGFLVVLALHTPVAYWVKARHGPTRWAPLGRQLLASLKVTGITLATPIAWVAAHGFGREQPLPWTQFLAMALLALLGWVAAVEWTRHPVAADSDSRRPTRIGAASCRLRSAWSHRPLKATT